MCRMRTGCTCMSGALPEAVFVYTLNRRAERGAVAVAVPVHRLELVRLTNTHRSTSLGGAWAGWMSVSRSIVRCGRLSQDRGISGNRSGSTLGVWGLVCPQVRRRTVELVPAPCNRDDCAILTRGRDGKSGSGRHSRPRQLDDALIRLLGEDDNDPLS